MMHMAFYWSREVTLLFYSWHTTTWLSYCTTLLASALASMVYQYLESRRIRLSIVSSTPDSSIHALLLQQKATGREWRLSKIRGALLFGVNSAVAYLLMLAVMSFNGGVFLAVVVGLMIGYLLFRGVHEHVVVGNLCACA